MKAKITFFTSVLLTAVWAFSFGQKGVEDRSQWGHGEDSIRCLKNYSLYREYARLDNYKDAYPFWTICFNECPLASKNLYIDGARMFKERIEKETDPEKQQVLIDSLMLIYDQRAKYFPEDEGRVLGYKGLDLLRYQRDNLDVIETANGFLKKSIQLSQHNSSAAVLATFMTSSITLFRYERVPAERVVEDYALVSEVVDKAIARDPDDRDLALVKNNVDQNFAACGAANCDALIKLFGPQYEANKTNGEFLKKVTELLSNTGCKDSELYRNTAESLHKLEPAAKSAYELARLFKGINQFDKAIRYYNQAIEMETDPKERSRYYVELGDLTFREKNDLPKAKQYAMKAAEEDPTNGVAFLLAGNIIASAKDCGENELEKKALYWLAVDYFVRAKQVDPALEETANQYINTYSQHFPDIETIFFHGYKEGDAYTIECWINETTRVRTR